MEIKILILLVLGGGALALPLDTPRPGFTDKQTMTHPYDQKRALEPITGLNLPRNEFTPRHLLIRERDRLRRLEEIKFTILSSLFPDGQFPPRGSNPSMIPSIGFPQLLPPIPQDAITKTHLFYLTGTNGTANGSGSVYPPMSEFDSNDDVSSGGDGEEQRLKKRDLREKNEGGIEDFKLDDHHPLRQILVGISRSIRNRGMRETI